MPKPSTKPVTRFNISIHRGSDFLPYRQGNEIHPPDINPADYGLAPGLVQVLAYLETENVATYIYVFECFVDLRRRGHFVYLKRANVQGGHMHYHDEHKVMVEHGEVHTDSEAIDGVTRWVQSNTPPGGRINVDATCRNDAEELLGKEFVDLLSRSRAGKGARLLNLPIPQFWKGEDVVN